jgi:hypothetical protein
MTSDDKIIRAYLQAAHDRGGSYTMAMSMMVNRIILLEDRLTRASVSFEPDMVIAKAEVDGT